MFASGASAWLAGPAPSAPILTGDERGSRERAAGQRKVRRAVSSASPAPVPEPGRRRLSLVWLLATAAFFLMSAGWALGLPLNGTYDESQQAIRAYAAASGQLYSAPDTVLGGALFRVPESLMPDNVNCTWQQDRRPASCQHRTPTSRKRVLTNSAAGRFNPLYYALVGLPEVLRPTFAGIVGTRLLSGLLSALLLGTAATIAWAWRRQLLLGALVLAVTPMVMDLAGSVNPNGLEISAGTLCWTALLTLLRRDGDERQPSDRALMWCAGLSGALLLTLRSLGPLFVVMIAAAAWPLSRPGRIPSLWARRELKVTTRLLVAVLAAAGAYAVGWTLLSGQLGVIGTLTGSTEPGLGTVRLIVDERLDFWVQQFVGVFSYGETPLPRWTYLVWYALGGALVVPAAILGRRRDTLSLLAIGVATIGTLTTLEVHYRPILGLSQHGRYLMPFGVGLILGSALVPQWARALGPAGIRRLALTIVLISAPLQFYALGAVMTRFERGVSALWQPFGTGWQPLLGTVAPLAAEALGLVLLAVVVASCPRPAPAARVDSEVVC